MFDNAVAYNKPLKLNTGKVTDMSFMFRNAYSFNQDLFMDTRRVVSFASMFDHAIRFQGSISGFEMTNAKTAMAMFQNAAIHQNLCFLARGRNPDGFVTTNMFRGAKGCPARADPNLNQSIPGPFCFPCLATEEPSSSPSGPTSQPHVAPTLQPHVTPTSQPHVAPTSQPSRSQEGCCSHDFKNCVSGCGNTESTCGFCAPNDHYKWLKHGALPGRCRARRKGCLSDDSCCPGLTCEIRDTWYRQCRVKTATRTRKNRD